MFSKLYQWMLRVSRHPHADWYLGGISFAESSFFPIPPDVMLAPMALARPQQWIRLATLTTVTSVLGGLFGYTIGYFLLDAVLPLLASAGYREAYDTAVAWFAEYGFWAIFIAGFTPVPYKIFTICAGAAHMALLPFLIGSIVGRGGRFFLVAGLVRLLGPSFEKHLLRYVDAIGWALLVLIVAGLAIWKLQS
ncbi:MAG TPA: YqaA family protein [Solimonas sp.]